LVDANCPWRLVVNLESPLVQRNILNGRNINDFSNWYSDTYLMKTFEDDFWRTKSLYELLYRDYYLATQGSLPPEHIQVGIIDEQFIKPFLINRFRELGLMDLNPSGFNPNFQFSESGVAMVNSLAPSESRRPTLVLNFESILQETLRRYRRSGQMSGISGPLGYVESICSSVVRKTLERS
jgi:hypothetical protein